MVIEKYKTFKEQIFKSYKYANKVKSFCKIKKFKKQTDYFWQVAHLFKLPKDFFKEDNRMIAESFSRLLANGEQDYVLNSLIENSPQYEMSSFNLKELGEACACMDNPTDIFIPIDPFFGSLCNLVYNDKPSVIYEPEGEPLLLFGDKIIRINWLTSYAKIKEVIVLDRSKIEVIQKRFEKKDVYLDLKEQKNHFDFIIKTVISKPRFKKNSFMVIKCHNPLTEKAQISSEGSPITMSNLRSVKRW